MSDSNWSVRDKAIAAGFFVFCGLILSAAIYWTGALAGYQEGRSVEARTQHEAHTKRQIEQACEALTGARMMECVYDTTAASEEAKRSEQDLEAQQGMERWALWMVAAAFAQTLVAGAALVFLMKDLRQNRRSAEQQLRAYLVLQEFVWNTDKGDYYLQIQWTNKGQTPAYNADAISDWVALDNPLPEDFDFALPKSESEYGSAMTGPEQSIFGTCEVSLGPELVSLAANGQKHIYLWGKATYRDAFGRDRFSECAVKVDAKRLDGSIVMRWASLARHNNAN